MQPTELMSYIQIRDGRVFLTYNNANYVIIMPLLFSLSARYSVTRRFELV